MTATLNPPRGGLAAMLALLFALGAVPAEAQDKPVTLVMPACPIHSATVPSGKTELPIPSADPLTATLDVAGTVQVADQTGAVISKTSVNFDVLPTGIDFSRTVNTLQFAAGDAAFDKGCTKSDPYGSNDCHWDYAETVQMASQGALQEDVTAGKIVVDLKLNNTTPFSFSCPVCGADCSVTVPDQLDQTEIWNLLFSLVPSPPTFLIHVPSPPAAPTIAASFTPSTIVTNTTSALSFTLTNPNPGIALTGAGFTDSLPTGVVVSTPNGLAGSCGGGTIAATAGGSSVSLTGATLASGASCTFSIDVTSADAGNYVNTTGAVSANESFVGSMATASLNAVNLATGAPILSHWSRLLLGCLIISGGFLMLGRRKSRRDLHG